MTSSLRYFLLLFGLLIMGSVVAQPGRYTTENKKAIKAYEEGVAALNVRELERSKQALLKAVQADPDFLEPHLVLAEIYATRKQDDKAIEEYTFVMDKNPRFFPEAMVHLGHLHQRNERFGEAKEWYDRFLQGKHNARTMNKARMGSENCDFAITNMKRPVPFEPVNLGPTVNTDAPEYYPCITADDQHLIFTRLVKDQRAPQGMQEDFFISQANDTAWDVARGFPVVNSVMNEGAGTLSPDGQYLIFTACEVFGKYGEGRRGLGSCDLFVSRKLGGRWTPPQNMGPPVNSSHWESQPSLASDGKTLYFIRGITDREGKRTQDIYTSTLQPDGSWSKPVALPKSINSPYLEESVQIHPDGRTLYFSSNGHPGMGGLDIYMARMQLDGSWGSALNLGYPINTASDENSLLVSANGELAFFASDRDGGYGDLDLYSFELYKEARPTPVSYIEGKVVDAFSKKPLEAQLELIDLESGDLATGTFSDPRTGEFLLCLPAGRDYALDAEAPDHLFYSENYAFAERASIDEPYDLLVELRKLTSGETITLRNIFFETASYELLPASNIELDRLLRLMQRQPELRIEVGGHTDDVGDDAANQELSEQRADAVKQFLVGYGIDQSRVVAKGYGEKMPTDSNETEEGRARNRRTEIKVL